MVNLLTHICVTRPQWVKRHMQSALNLIAINKCHKTNNEKGELQWCQLCRHDSTGVTMATSGAASGDRIGIMRNRRFQRLYFSAWELQIRQLHRQGGLYEDFWFCLSVLHNSLVSAKCGSGFTNACFTLILQIDIMILWNASKVSVPKYPWWYVSFVSGNGYVWIDMWQWSNTEEYDK